MNSESIFNFTVWDTMRMCLASFPAPAKINPSEIATHIESISQELESMEGAFEYAQKVHSESLRAIRWLEHEGFIYFDSVQADYYNAIIAHKGLKALDSVPVSIGGKKKFRDIFSESMIGASAAEITKMINEFIRNVPDS